MLHMKYRQCRNSNSVWNLNFENLFLLPLDSVNVSTEMKSITFNICWLSKDLAIKKILTGVKAGHLKFIFHFVWVKRIFYFFSSKYVIIADIFLSSSSMSVPVSEISGVWFKERVSGWEGGETHGLTNLAPGAPAHYWARSSHLITDIASHHSHVAR